MVYIKKGRDQDERNAVCGPSTDPTPACMCFPVVKAKKKKTKKKKKKKEAHAHTHTHKKMGTTDDTVH